jgi:hypothetical protein
MSQHAATDRSRIALVRRMATLARGPQRMLLLPAIGAAIGLILAGLTLFRAAPGAVSVVPAGYVALVNQKGILMSDFMAQTVTETAKDFDQTSEAERRTVLREMINEELLVQRGLSLDLPETTTEVRQVIASAVDVQSAASILAQRPTDAELRSYYESHRSDFATVGYMVVHDLVLHVGGYQNADQSTAQAQTDAGEAVYQLRSGASLDYVKDHFGLVDSGRVDNGEQLDFAAKLHLGAALYQVAITLGDGQISDPVLESDGVHVLVMDRRAPPKVADFSQVRARVYTGYRDAQVQAANEANLKSLRREAQILMAPGQSE